jgi:hypothetical protein
MTHVWFSPHLTVDLAENDSEPPHFAFHGGLLEVPEAISFVFVRPQGAMHPGNDGCGRSFPQVGGRSRGPDGNEGCVGSSHRGFPS